MRLRLIPIMLLLLVSFSLSAEDEQKSYLCVADKATGFVFQESSKTWEIANDKVRSSKYVVRPVKSDDQLALKNRVYGVWQLGDEFPISTCEKGFDRNGWLRCTDFGVVYRMDAVTKRYYFYSPGAYMTATRGGYSEDGVVQLRPDKGGDSPLIEIGKCSEI